MAELPVPPCEFGPYEIVSEIARGGMGVVYKARQKGLDRYVALKMVLSNQLNSPNARMRFLQEARSAASLDHPNVVAIHDAGEIDGKLFFTMAFVEGTNLRQYVQDQDGLKLSRAMDLFFAIVAAVGHAHENGIIHRDLKPANVLIDREGRARVTDFGLA
ncbi:MAG: serine/threonine-protein kinase, partial [Gemmataceae bacterium]